MKTPTERNTTTPAVPPMKPADNKVAANTQKMPHRADDLPESLEVGSEVVSTQEWEKRPTGSTNALAGQAPAQAAKGDDDLMSQPAAKTANPTLKARWQEKISAAKAMWTKLTEPELTSIEGQAHKLADLVQKRYVTTREEADKQVTGFFKKHFSDLPSDDEIKGNWKQQVGAAKIAWGKLTEDELLKTEGQQMRLAGLVQSRYSIQRDEAEKQVKAFLEKNRETNKSS